MPTHAKLSYVLVTGGAGYIGSQTVIELLSKNYQVIVIDDLKNSCIESMNRVAQITGKRPLFRQISLLDKKALYNLFEKFNIWAVIHFAGLKAVNESFDEPLRYYENNVVGSCNLLLAMRREGCRNLVFSSSATVYGNLDEEEISENHFLHPISPYGRTKLMVELIIDDICQSDPTMNAIILRYFNPIGAHPSGIIGENPLGPPNNLLPCITQSLVKSKQLNVFGTDYPTKDGTAVRDYIHVVDLALGHLAALEKLRVEKTGCVVYNMGNGRGYSVLEVIACVDKVSGKRIEWKGIDRRPGDASKMIADPTKAYSELNWKPIHDLNDMCSSAWNWQKQNHKGLVSTLTFCN
ncbi:uncharacterized protein VTP21DRAFT_2589 [Calcarisporiella thermophila]|uniref:uncharacterized protein n=1 Tax=Calcarisporiella thermophila TaxID=911321 RepID=UPI00374420CE